MNFSRATLVLGVFVGCNAVASLTMFGCSGDDTVSPADASADNTTDVQQQDVVDTGMPDVLDAGKDAPPDAPGMTFAEFAAQQVDAICGRYAQCCFGADAAAFDKTVCLSLVKDFGWEGNLQSPSAIAAAAPPTDAGADAEAGPPALNFNVDPVAAQQCLAALSTFACPTISATEDKFIIESCYKAVAGKLTAGQGPCSAAVECTPGNYCKPSTDGGASSCAPLEGPGGPCSTVAFNDACQYRSYVGAQSRCDLVAPDGGVGSKKCVRREANGVPCSTNWDCASGVCEYNTSACGTTTLTTTSFICAYMTKDGG